MSRGPLEIEYVEWERPASAAHAKEIRREVQDVFDLVEENEHRSGERYGNLLVALQDYEARRSRAPWWAWVIIALLVAMLFK